MNVFNYYLRASLVLLFVIIYLSLKSQDQYTNLPSFYITTDDGQSITEKEVWKPGRLVVKSSVASENLDIVTEIRGRGNSTWGMAKKPYRIKLNSKKNLLNLPAKEKNWVLLANYADKTLMRNAVAFKISEIVGLEFTPSVRFVDLIMNGRFEGSYMLTDQIEVKDYRVPIEEQDVLDVTEPALSGGYLLEIDGFAGGEPVWFSTGKGVPITIKYPKDDEINNTQKNYIINYIADFESRLFSSNFTHETLGYRAKVDTTTLINWYIASELTGNSDAFWSTYIYKKRSNDKLYFGPLWDYDIAFNNDQRLGDAINKLMRENAHSYRTWIERFWQDEWFRKAVNRRWTELLDNNILGSLTSYINETSELLDESQRLNFQRWGRLNERVYLETFLFSTYGEGVDYLNLYITKRINFLTESFAKSDLSPSVPFVPDADAYYMIMNKQTKNVIQLENASKENNGLLNLWEALPSKDTQQWKIVLLENGYVNIINKFSGFAMTGNGHSMSLKQSELSASSDTQKWKIVPLFSGNIYGIVNKATDYSINNSGGGSDNGNRVIEYTNNIYSEDKVNQHWFFVKAGTDGSTGIDLAEFSDKMILYPNPARDNAFVEFSIEKFKKVELSIYSISGECFYVNSFNLSSEKQVIQLPISGLQSGIYFVVLNTDSGLFLRKKLIVNNNRSNQ